MFETGGDPERDRRGAGPEAGHRHRRHRDAGSCRGRTCCAKTWRFCSCSRARRHRARDARAMRCVPAARAGALAGVAEACAAAGYDWALVPRERLLSRVRLVAMDMDSTLITIECIDEIAALRGIGDEVAAITAAAMRGEIDFRASLERRVALLAGLPVSDARSASTTSGCRFRRAPNDCSTPAAASARKRCSFPAASRSSPTGCRRASHSTTRCRTCWRSSDGQLTGGCSAADRRRRRPRPRASASSRTAIAATTASRSRSATAPTTCRCWPCRRVDRLSREAARACAAAMHAIDHCGLDAVLNLFA